MEKKAQLIIAQIDHLSVKMLGFAVDTLLHCGAHHVQIVPTITKKNRRGNFLIIDTGQEQEEIIAGFLVKELQVTGYRSARAEDAYRIKAQEH